MTVPGEAQQRAERILRQTIGVQEQTPDLRDLAADVLALVERVEAAEASADSWREKALACLETLKKANDNTEDAEKRVAMLEAAVQCARTDLGMTAYEGTSVSVWSAKNIETYLGAALAGVPVAEPPPASEDTSE